MSESDTREVAFFGRVAAAYTHEMKNVLAVVKESAGLMEDLLQTIPPEAFPHHGRFVRALTTVLDQVRRGVEMTNRLNRFAHTADIPISTIDLYDTVTHLTHLVYRFARLKNVVLEVAATKPHPITLTTSAVHLQMALFKGLECCWNALQGGGTIVLTVSSRNGSPAVGIQCRQEEPVSEGWGGLAEKVASSEEWNAVERIGDSLGGKIQWDPSGWEVWLVFDREAA